MGRPPIDQQVTFVYVSELERSRRFYEQTLQLELALDQGSCRIYRVAGEAFLGLCARPDAVSPEGVILTLVTPDVEGFYAYLAAAGVELEGPARRNPDYDIVHFFARDPDGYRVEVQRFCDPSWPAPAT